MPQREVYAHRPVAARTAATTAVLISMLGVTAVLWAVAVQFTQTMRDVAPEEYGCKTVEHWRHSRSGGSNAVSICGCTRATAEATRLY